MKVFLPLLLLFSTLSAASTEKMHAQYSSLDPKSIYQHLAFYQLYPKTREGKKALEDGWKLFSNQLPPKENILELTNSVPDLIKLFCGNQDKNSTKATEQSTSLMKRVGQNLANRRLKGSTAMSEQEVLALPPNEIDLGRALLLSQMDQDPKAMDTYEATLDLLALEVLSHIGPNATDREKILGINNLIFDELGIRFPPQSIFSEQIDGYTFLPTVLDSRRGVCLGVSILYLCLAQRLDLPLEIITPPGHIYIRYRSDDEVTNIETTARGIHIESEHYLNINTRGLQERNIKEVVGLAHMNEAAAKWHQKNPEEVLKSYEKAFLYLPNDALLTELAGYNYLFVGDTDKGVALLKEIQHHIPDHAVMKESLASDYLNKKVNAEGISLIFEKVDDDFESLMKHKEKLQTVLDEYPLFRSGHFAIAALWLQLNRLHSGLESLDRYHELDDSNPTVEFYLAMVHIQRHHFPKAWKHFNRAKEILANREHNPKALKELETHLTLTAPR